MKFGDQTRGLWLRARYREGQFEGEACLLAYDDESFSDLLVSGDVKAVFEKRAGTANVFVVAPFLNGEKCRKALQGGAAIQRASSYLAGKTGNIYLVELVQMEGANSLALQACPITWHVKDQEAKFGVPIALAHPLLEGWLFDLFDSNEGLVKAPAGIHFKKSSRKHTTTFLRAANSLTSSVACGLFALFALPLLGSLSPKRIFVDTAPLLSLAFAVMRVARVHGMWLDDVPARSFSSYGGLQGVGRLSGSDIVLVSATTSGSLAHEVIQLGAKSERVVTLYFLGEKFGARPVGVLCDLTIAPHRSFGYQPVINFPANDCYLCKEENLLAELEGDQFLLQRRQHRLIRVLQKTQSIESKKTLTELNFCGSLSVILRTSVGHRAPVVVDEELLLSAPEIRGDYIRLLRRYCPLPLELVVLVNINIRQIDELINEAGMRSAFGSAKFIDWVHLPQQKKLLRGSAVLVVFGCLSNHMQARSINASLRAVVDGGNVAYLSVLTLANNPEQYQDLKMFLGYGERGLETFTYRDARRLALPGGFGLKNSWEEESELLDVIADVNSPADLLARRSMLAAVTSSKDDLFLQGKYGSLKIQRDFVYLNTSDGVDGISQADIFAVVANLLCVARSANRELTAKVASPNDITELTQSVYGHILISPQIFTNYNDAVLKASFLRAAKPSELMYEVDENHSRSIAEIILSELAAWDAGTGEALPEMLLAMATKRLKLREIERINIRSKAIAAQLPDFYKALAIAIPE